MFIQGWHKTLKPYLQQVCLGLLGLGMLLSSGGLYADEKMGNTDKDDAETAIVLGSPQINMPTTLPSISQSSIPSTAVTDTGKTSDPLPAQPDSSIIQAQLPSLNAPVIDSARILNAQELAALSQQILAIHQSARAQIGLILLPSSGQEPIFDYAVRAFTTWQLGDQKNDNGLLIVVAVNDRKIQILTGYGLEGVLPDVVVKRIIAEQITPLFKENNYAGGLQAGISKIDDILKQDPDVARASAEQLKQQQDAQLQQANAMQQGLIALVILSVGGMLCAMFLGKSLSASLAGAGGIAWGLFSGLGVFASLLLGGAVFFLLITSLAQLIFQILLQVGLSGGRGGGGGGFGSGGGYSGGGGSFGGGGASGSW